MPTTDQAQMSSISQSLLKGSKDEINRQLFAILNSVNDGLYITDGDANTILVNDAYEAISGLRRRAVLGRNMRDIVSGGLINRSGSLEVLKTRGPVTLEQTFGTGKRALITSTPHFDGEGRIALVVTVVRDITEIRRLQQRLEKDRERRRAEMAFLQRASQFGDAIVAHDPTTLEVLSRARKVAALDTTVLLLGETGVGKEQLARYIYENSNRADQTFIGINCGAIPPSLIESELFGYEKGAFTGAGKTGKMGLFESADNGTVFLDEVGDLPLELQVHLLRVLQEMSVRRVGGVRSIPVNTRIIAATNRDLADMVRNKTFREDLYYRLNVVPIEIPPLRRRPGDIRPLVDSFLATMNKKYQYHKAFSREALDVLHHYAWPGNVRELKNVVEQAVILSAGDEILASDLPISCRCGPAHSGSGEEGSIDLKKRVAAFEYEYLVKAYERHGTVRAAAASLGMDSATFVRKRKKYQKLLQK